MYISFDLRRRRRSQTQTHMLTDNYCSGPPQHQNSENVPTCSLLKESRWSPQAQKYQSPLQQLGNTTPASLWSHITDSKVQKWDLTIRVESRLENRDWSQTAAVKISCLLCSTCCDRCWTCFHVCGSSWVQLLVRSYSCKGNSWEAGWTF